jgi:hypothetical protein
MTAAEGVVIRHDEEWQNSTAVTRISSKHLRPRLTIINGGEHKDGDGEDKDGDKDASDGKDFVGTSPDYAGDLEKALDFPLNTGCYELY